MVTNSKFYWIWKNILESISLTNIGKANIIYRGLQNFNELDLEAKQEIIDAELTQYKSNHTNFNRTS